MHLLATEQFEVGSGACPLDLVADGERLDAVFAARLPVYAGLARITVVTDDRDPQEIADELAAAITARIAAAAGEGAGTARTR